MLEADYTTELRVEFVRHDASTEAYLDQRRRPRRRRQAAHFADPEGNADRLFVFHRDVDAVRKKLGGKQ
jgi:hypothetical protein